MRAPLTIALLMISASAFAQGGYSPNTTPFHRVNDPVMVAIGPMAQTTIIPASAMLDTDGVTKLGSFYIANPNNVWVRLKGFNNQADCDAGTPVTAATGWLFPPGFVAVFSTQYPKCVSAMAVSEPGYPVTSSTQFAPLELAYGTGQ